ncbi:MAG: V4R domain-containing protein [Candidatus Bathyarchaeia archaeon]
MQLKAAYPREVRTFYPRELETLIFPEEGERVVEALLILKERADCLKKIFTLLHEIGAEVKHMEMYRSEWDAGKKVLAMFLAFPKDSFEANSLKDRLRELDVAEELEIVEPKPLPYETMLFPIRNLQNRVLLFRAAHVHFVMDRMEKILTPAGAAVIFFNMGLENGRALRRFVDTMAWSRDLSFEEKLWALKHHLKSAGMGVVEFLNVDLEEGYASVRVYGSFEADGRKKGRPICHVTRGLLAGFFEEALGKKVKAAELKCAAMGNDFCEFEIHFRP